MIFLRNFDEFNKCLDLESGTEIVLNQEIKTVGWYKNLRDSVCSFFVQEGSIFLKNGEPAIVIGNDTKSTLKPLKNGINEFQLLNGGKTILAFQYNSEIDLYGETPFEYLDEEEFDWGLFLVNIINNNASRQVFIENNS